MEQTLLICNRCTHSWKPRLKREGVPKDCPGCKSPYWNKPRKEGIYIPKLTLSDPDKRKKIEAALSYISSLSE